MKQGKTEFCQENTLDVIEGDAMTLLDSQLCLESALYQPALLAGGPNTRETAPLALHVKKMLPVPGSITEPP